MIAWNMKKLKTYSTWIWKRIFSVRLYRFFVYSTFKNFSNYNLIESSGIPPKIVSYISQWSSYSSRNSFIRFTIILSKLSSRKSPTIQSFFQELSKMIVQNFCNVSTSYFFKNIFRKCSWDFPQDCFRNYSKTIWKVVQGCLRRFFFYYFFHGFLQKILRI